MADKYLYHSPDSPDVECVVCGNGLRTRWTDTHGIGACVTCGCVYSLFEGKGSEKKIAEVPKTTIRDEWLPIIKRYWSEVGKNVSPGTYNFPGSSYEVASNDDFDSYYTWMEAHESELPKP